MKKIAKVLLMLGVFLVFSAGLWAAPDFVFCVLENPNEPTGLGTIIRVPVEARDALEAQGWVCRTCRPPDCPT